MIYMSTFCIRADTIRAAVEALRRDNFRYIELSGGTNFYAGIEDDLLDLKRRHGLEYLLHNYFPPPKRHFVLNLASLDDDIYRRTLASLEGSIQLSKKLNAKKFGLHAGFFIDIAPEQIGGIFNYKNPSDRGEAVRRFCAGFNILKKTAPEMQLYIENNVISGANLKTFGGRNILMMTNYCEYSELKKLIDFKLLLDTGHLKVSCNSLGLNFEEELDRMIRVSDYLHLSDNDGLTDQHKALEPDSVIFKTLKNYDLKDKIVVFEVRDDKRAYLRQGQDLC